MPKSKKPKDPDQVARIISKARQEREKRQGSYRERALKLFPWVCGRCGREFEGKRVRELTVHHKDHNHDNNPPDGSNWELLCIYCHDNEHDRDRVAEYYDEDSSGGKEDSSTLSHKPFAGLDELLKKMK